MLVGLTGARGVLGTRISEALIRHGHEINPFVGDVRNLSDLEAWVSDLQVVVHAAAVVPVEDVAQHPSEAIAVNVGGTANVALAVSKTSNCRMVYLSTSHAYRSIDRPIVETDPIDPVSLYGLSKFQGEEWVRRLVEDALIVRVFSFFDDRQARPYLVPSLRERLMFAAPNAELELHGANNIRDLADARFLGEICARLAVERSGGVVNCGTGHSYSILEIANELANAMGRKDVTWREAANSQVSVLVANTAELSRRFGGFMPPFDLAESLHSFATIPAIGARAEG